jgi:hypothetical protein
MVCRPGVAKAGTQTQRERLPCSGRELASVGDVKSALLAAEGATPDVRATAACSWRTGSRLEGTRLSHFDHDVHNNNSAIVCPPPCDQETKF